jgi:hypothetical protein
MSNQSNEPDWGWNFRSVKVWVPWLLGLAGGVQQLFITPPPNPVAVTFILILLGIPVAGQLIQALGGAGAQAQSPSGSSPSSSSPSSQSGDGNVQP